MLLWSLLHCVPRAWVNLNNVCQCVSVFNALTIHSVLGNHLWINIHLIMFYVQGLSFSAWNLLSRTCKSRNILTFKFTHNSFLFLQIWNKRSYLRLIEILQETADAGINPFWKTPFTLLVRACLSPWLTDSSSTHFLTERSARCCWPLRAHYFLRKSTGPGARCVTRLISEWGDSSACGTLAPRAEWRHRDSRSWKQMIRYKHERIYLFLLLLLFCIIIS